MAEQVKLVVDAHALLGEGAIWDIKRQSLLWVDIDGCAVHVYDPAADCDRTISLEEKVGTIVPRASGGVMLAVEHGFASLDLDTERLEIVADPEADITDNRMNDGKCDPEGRFWAGTMSPRKGGGSVWCLEPDKTVRKMISGVSTSNGIVWSLDAKRMYYIDTPTRQIVAYDYDRKTGRIANRTAVIEVPLEFGHPDGMTIDAEGKLWVAHWGGWRVCRWDPLLGKLMATIKVPASKVTSCAFGGAGLDELYITTARVGIKADALEQEPQAGGLFLIRPGVKGVPAFEYAG